MKIDYYPIGKQYLVMEIPFKVNFLGQANNIF